MLSGLAGIVPTVTPPGSNDRSEKTGDKSGDGATKVNI